MTISLCSVRFRLGEFESGAYPFSDVDPSLIDSPAHRALARESAAASVVLAQNNRLTASSPAPVLPLTLQGPLAIAVVGPFAHCTDVDIQNAYLHSYNGVPSYIVTMLDAIQEEAVAAPGNVTVTFVF